MPVVSNAFPFLLQGALVTIYVSLLGTVIGVPIGVIILVLRRSPVTWLETLAKAYVSYFRGVPLLVQLLVFYNLLPWIGIDLSATAAAVLALGLISGGYVAEILRGAMNAIPQGQSEAAHVLGYGARDRWRFILLPQIFRLSVPALLNELTLMMKSSSLISVVGIAELTRVSQNIVASTFRPLEIYAAAGAIYIALTQILLAIGRLAEARLLR